jgi:hypothetical protein
MTIEVLGRHPRVVNVSYFAKLIRTPHRYLQLASIVLIATTELLVSKIIACRVFIDPLLMQYRQRGAFQLQSQVHRIEVDMVLLCLHRCADISLA